MRIVVFDISFHSSGGRILLAKFEKGSKQCYSKSWFDLIRAWYLLFVSDVNSVSGAFLNWLSFCWQKHILTFWSIKFLICRMLFAAILLLISRHPATADNFPPYSFFYWNHSFELGKSWFWEKVLELILLLFKTWKFSDFVQTPTFKWKGEI